MGYDLFRGREALCILTCCKTRLKVLSYYTWSRVVTYKTPENWKEKDRERRKKKSIATALSSMPGISGLRSEKTQLSQSTYACVKVLTQSTNTAGGTLNCPSLMKSVFRTISVKAFRCFLITWWCFSPEAAVEEERRGQDSASSQIPYYLFPSLSLALSLSLCVLENALVWLVRGRLPVIL